MRQFFSQYNKSCVAVASLTNGTGGHGGLIRGARCCIAAAPMWPVAGERLERRVLLHSQSPPPSSHSCLTLLLLLLLFTFELTVQIQNKNTQMQKHKYTKTQTQIHKYKTHTPTLAVSSSFVSLLPDTTPPAAAVHF